MYYQGRNATALNVDGLYKLNTPSEHLNVAKGLHSQTLWHRKLGLLNYVSMGLLKMELTTNVVYKEKKEPVYWDSCIKSKQAKGQRGCPKQIEHNLF